MSVTYTTTLGNSRLQLVNDLVASKTVAASTGGATAGQLVIGTASLSGSTGVLATIALVTTGTAGGPFNTPSSKVLTLAGVPLSATATATGTAALAEFRNNAGTTVASGLTVGTSGTDIILNSTAISSGQTVQITAGTITHP